MDLDNVVVANPNAGGVCNLDTIKITSASSPTVTIAPVPPTLCGTLSGSHCKL